MSIDWRPLDRAIEQHGAPILWWRDDDAVAPSASLTRLIELTESVSAPLLLASIPDQTTRALAREIETRADIAVAVHGWAHTNHAPADEKKAEFGAHRAADILRGEAQRGLKQIEHVFGAAATPIFVPPWNRFAPELPKLLSEVGYRALSGFTQRDLSHAPIMRFDAHLDPIAWRGNRSAVDPNRLIELTARLIEESDAPIGLMTHHLVHDEAIWSLITQLIRYLAEREAVWIDLRELFTDG